MNLMKSTHDIMLIIAAHGRLREILSAIDHPHKPSTHPITDVTTFYQNNSSQQ